jgi:nickel/cobalt transporter (NicO) family protein
MSHEMIVLAGTAATVGFVHTVLGPDHYLPFVAMSKAGNWSDAKTAIVTLLCGLGHVMSSVVLGFVGVFLGTAVFKLQALESVRGDLAGWLLIAFGLTYMLWGLRRAILNQPHEHRHVHADGSCHSHDHTHVAAHTHVHARAKSEPLTPWVLFTIFVLGPCEPLIPLIMYPAARSSVAAAAGVSAIFGVTTIATMLVLVLAARHGLSRVSFPHVQRYSHAIAGLAILLCGGTIQFLGL